MRALGMQRETMPYLDTATETCVSSEGRSLVRQQAQPCLPLVRLSGACRSEMMRQRKDRRSGWGKRRLTVTCDAEGQDTVKQVEIPWIEHPPNLMKQRREPRGKMVPKCCRIITCNLQGRRWGDPTLWLMAVISELWVYFFFLIFFLLVVLFLNDKCIIFGGGKIIYTLAGSAGKEDWSSYWSQGEKEENCPGGEELTLLRLQGG